MAPHITLATWWSKTGADVVTRKTSEDDIAALEARYSFVIPDDFRQYLKEVIPAAENYDDEDGNWWPLDRLKSIPDEYEYPVGETLAKNAGKHLIFLDCMMWSWAWAISCAEDETRGKVALVGSSPDGYVADSFAEFVDRYTTDWMSISRVQKRKETPSGRSWARLWRR